MTEHTLAPGDLVRPVGGPDLPPKPIQSVHTTDGGDFEQPLSQPQYVVNGTLFLARELVLVTAADGATPRAMREDGDGR